MMPGFLLGTRRLMIAGVLAIGIFAGNAFALILVGKGNDPIPDNHWPDGSLALANLKTRIGWSEGPPFGGGQHSFMYHAGPADFQAAIDLFAKIKVPGLQVFIHDGGPAESPFLTDDKNPAVHLPVDWYFTVWNPESWKHLHQAGSRLAAEDPNGGMGKDVEPPRIDVYVGGDKGLDIASIHFPKSVIVTDERADMNGFKDGSAIVGDVTDLSTGKPIANATVQLAKSKSYEQWTEAVTVRSDAKGHYEITNAPKGSFGVLASAPGYAPRMLGYVEFRGNTFKNRPARLALASTLAGVVIDQDGKPVTKVNVRPDGVTGSDDSGYILPAKPKAVTDDNGHFMFEGLPSGHAQIFASADHYLIADALAVQAIPSEALKIRVVATGGCKGRVIDAAGKPDPNANVSIRPEAGETIGSYGGSTNVSPDGTFNFNNVPPGRYLLRAHTNIETPRAKVETPITVKAGAPVEIDLKL